MYVYVCIYIIIYIYIYKLPQVRLDRDVTFIEEEAWPSTVCPPS